jgi:hypothetical protein
MSIGLMATNAGKFFEDHVVDQGPAHCNGDNPDNEPEEADGHSSTRGSAGNGDVQQAA